MHIPTLHRSRPWPRLESPDIVFQRNIYSYLSKRRFAGRHEKVTGNKLYVWGVPFVGIGTGFYLIISKVLQDRMMENEEPSAPLQPIVDRKGDGEEEEEEEENLDPHLHYLRVRVIDGEVFHDYDLGGGADAYVQIGYNGKRKKTKAVKGTRTPRWNTLLRFKEAKPGKKLSIWMWDYDKLQVDDFIGIGTIKAEDLPREYNEVKEITVQLKCPNKEDRGSVRLKVDFTRVNRI